jgi:hypothetical protein
MMNPKNLIRFAMICVVLGGCGGEWRRSRDTGFKDAEEALCRRIPGWAMSFPVLNGAPKQVWFERSNCLQQVAVQKRQRALCQSVKTARVIFLDGSGISKGGCEAAVDKETAVDISAKFELGEIHRFFDVNFSKFENRLWLYFQMEGTIDAQYDMLIRCSDPKGDAKVIFESKDYHLVSGVVSKYRIDIGKETSDWLMAHRKPDVKCEATLKPVGMASVRWERAMRVQKPSDLTTTYEFRLAAK